MSGVRRVLLMIAALAVAIGLAGCGGSDDQKTETVPADVAGPLVEILDDAQAKAAAGSCDDVQADADEFNAKVNLIGADQVDQDVKRELQEAGARLKSLSETDCTPTPTGASGAQGAVDPTTPAVAEAPDTSAGTSTGDETAKKSKPGKKAKAKARGHGDAKPPAKAKPEVTAKPDEPATAAKSAKDDKPAKKHGKGPKHNGPPGPKGNPNHEPVGNGSGGVTPEGGN